MGLLPAYLTYFNAHSEGGTAAIPSEATRHRFRWPARILGILGAILFLAGAIPLFYMAVAGLRILLPGYQIIVPLAQTASGSYLPSVALVSVGTLILLQGLVLVTSLSGLYFGSITTLGVISSISSLAFP